MKKHTTLCLPLVITSLAGALFSQTASAEPWNKRNNPDILNPNYKRVFADLPLSGKVPEEKTPWSESYWPDFIGGISFRWHAKDPQNFEYVSPTAENARFMTPEQIAEISPAEKYDLFMGHYDYPLVERVRKVSTKDKPEWRGICNGWAAASVFYSEPQPVTVKNPDGIEIPFGSSDVKALMSFYYAYDVPLNAARQMGVRCNSNIRSRWHLPDRSGACDDTNAGAFHIVMANQLGLQKEAFIADVDRGPEIWNNPVYEFKSEILKKDAPDKDSPEGTYERVLVQTHMIYANDDVKYSSWEPVLGTDKFHRAEKLLQYWLEIDAAGRIIGGTWESWERPDFLWLENKAEFKGYLEGINRLYQAKKQ